MRTVPPSAEERRTSSPAALRSVKNTDNHHGDFVKVDFIDDYVGQIGHSPFVGAGDSSDMSDLRKLADPLGFGKDARRNARCGLWAAALNVEANASDVSERFKREAHIHTPCFFLNADTSLSVARRVVALALRGLPVHTITFDNGFEFAHHKTMAQLLRCKVYFTDTHSPEQRGTNENFNGLVREFFPKGKSLAHVTQEDTTRVATILNGRPRKRLGFESPRTVFTRMSGLNPYITR